MADKTKISGQVSYSKDQFKLQRSQQWRACHVRAMMSVYPIALNLANVFFVIKNTPPQIITCAIATTGPFLLSKCSYQCLVWQVNGKMASFVKERQASLVVVIMIIIIIIQDVTCIFALMCNAVILCAIYDYECFYGLNLLS